MAGYHHLSGNVGRVDPELRHSGEGVAMFSFSLAVSEGRDKTTWYKIKCFRHRAEFAAKHIKKGEFVHVVGVKLEGRIYQDNVYLEVIANELSPAWKKSAGDGVKSNRDSPRQDKTKGERWTSQDVKAQAYNVDEIPF